MDMVMLVASFMRVIVLTAVAGMTMAVRMVMWMIVFLAVRVSVAVIMRMAMLMIMLSSLLLFPEFFAGKLFFPGGDHIQLSGADAAADHARNFQPRI
jgi:hypothetical protein